MNRTDEESLTIISVAFLFIFLVWRLFIFWDSSSFILFIGLAIILLCIATFFKVKGSVIFGIGLIILAFTFFWPLVGFVLFGVSATVDPSHLIIYLQGSSDNFSTIVNNALWYGIWPVAFGLIFCLVGYSVHRDFLENLKKLFLIFPAGFLCWWGNMRYQWAQQDYLGALHDAAERGMTNIDALNAIYSLYKWIGILYLITGAFFLLIVIHAIYRIHEGDDS